MKFAQAIDQEEEVRGVCGGIRKDAEEMPVVMPAVAQVFPKNHSKNLCPSVL